MAKFILKYPRTVLFLLYAILGTIIYSRVILEAGFVFDDFEYIVGNPLLYDLSALLQNFSDPRQVGYLSFALNYLIGGQAEIGYHLVNVVIHLANAVLVFFFAGSLLWLSGWKDEKEQGRPGIAFLVPAALGLIFLVHPLQTQAVSYVTQRFTSLAAFFYLASVTLYLQARRGMVERKQGQHSLTEYWIALLCALLAMKVKEISFTLPVAILALEMLLLSRGADRKRSIYLVVPFIATMVIIPLSILGPDWGLIDKSIGIAETTRVLKIEDLVQRSPIEYFATQMRVLIIYLRLLVFPYPQSVVYDLAASKSIFEIFVLLSLFVHLALVSLAVYLWIRFQKEDSERAPFLKMIALGIGWFYLTASVESSVLPIKDLIFEHRAYLPGIGILMAVLSALMLVVVGRPAHKQLVLQAAGAVVAISMVLGTAAYLRNRVWVDEFDLWDDMVAKMPNKAIGYNNRGNVLQRLGRRDEAFRDINTTINLFEKTIGQQLGWEDADYTPDNMSKTYMNRASLYREMGETEKADADMRTARMMVSGPTIQLETERKRADRYYEQGAYDSAIEVYNHILQWFPIDLDALVGRGNAYSMNKAYDKALADLNEAVRLHPTSPLPLYNRGVLYSRMAKRKPSQEDMQRACEFGFPLACDSVERSNK